jgi:hypothetical protein
VNSAWRLPSALRIVGQGAFATTYDPDLELDPMHPAASIGWRLRVKLFVERFWQPTSACMMCMPGSLGNLWSAVHWTTALRTGLVTGVLALVLSFTPVARLYSNRYGNALVVGGITAFGDAFSHPNHYGFFHAEALLTGAVSAALALVASYLFEDRARRLRSAWASLRSRNRPAEE